MAEIVSWRETEPNALAARVAQVLATGGLVAFPTEAVYQVAASALVPAGVERLPENKEPGQWALSVDNSSDALTWLPNLSRSAQRLIRRAWPGPLTLVGKPTSETNPFFRLQENVQRALLFQNGLSLRCANHPAVHLVQQHLAGPLILAEIGGMNQPITGEALLETQGNNLDLILQDGPCPIGRPTTVIRVEEDRWEMLREGPWPADLLAQLWPCRILFVCTGNTCRSPLAQVLCARLLAEKLGCSVAELPERGFLVESAGMAAIPGLQASPEAVVAAQAFDADLSHHRSQPLTPTHLDLADFILTMTGSHLRALEPYLVPEGPKARLLSCNGTDVTDPIGAPAEVYQACAQQIRGYLETLLPEFLAG